MVKQGRLEMEVGRAGKVRDGLLVEQGRLEIAVGRVGKVIDGSW